RADLLPLALLIGAQPTPRPELLLPARAVEAAGAGLERLYRGITAAGRDMVKYLPKNMEPQKPRKPQEPPRSVEVNFKMKQVDLAQFTQGLGLKLPFSLGGRLTFAVKAAIPIDSVKDLRAYRVHGTAELEQMRLADLDLEQVKVRVAFTEGVLS